MYHLTCGDLFNFYIVLCPSLTNPNNGAVSCSLGDDGVLSYQDTCRFTCNTGYWQAGSLQRTCQSDGSWSGSSTSCTIRECSSSSLPMNSMLSHCYSRTYLSRCDLQCEEGFVGKGDSLYVCNVFSGGVTWRATGSSWFCTRSKSLLKKYHSLIAVAFPCYISQFFSPTHVHCPTLLTKIFKKYNIMLVYLCAVCSKFCVLESILQAKI